MAKKKTESKSEIKSDKGSRRLALPESTDDEFNDIVNFGCYPKFFARDFFHQFYSLAVVYAVKTISPSELEEYFKTGEEFDRNPKKEKNRDAINADQLKLHDTLFKTIAYWYALKTKDNFCYRFIVQTNEARKFCEELFFRYYKTFLEKLKDLSSEIPNIDLLNDLDES